MLSRTLTSRFAVALVSTLAVQTHVLANTDLGPGVVNAAQFPYGAPVSSGQCTTASGSDATNAIQSALNNVELIGGGVVFLPSGVYCIRKHLRIPKHTTLKGVYQAPPTRTTPPTGGVFPVTQGTVLLAIENPGNLAGTPFISMDGSSSTLDGLTIYYPDQILPTSSNWTPIQYPYTIRASADSIIQNIFLLNPYQGIDLFTLDASRHIVKGIYGTPLYVGIKVDKSLDVGRISNIHFWPFWSYNQIAWDWVHHNGTALVFGRTDSQIVDDVFAFGYHTGMRFENFGNGPPNARMSNITFDRAGIGLDLLSTSRAGIQITNLSAATSGDPLVPNYPVWGHASSGNFTNLTVINGALGGHATQAIRWDSPEMIVVSGMRIFGVTGGLPIVSISGGQAMLQNNAFVGAIAGGQAINIGPSAGRVMLTGNMLFGGGVVVNNSMTLQANNQP